MSWFPAYNALVGVGAGLGAAIFFAVAPRYIFRDRLNERLGNLLLVGLLCGFIGALVMTRVVGVTHGPLLPLRGFSFYGGLLGGLAGVSVGCKVLKLPLLTTLDILAPSMAFAHACGRLGCLLGGCCYGYPTESHSFWHAMGFTRIPVQLIEATSCLLIGLVLLWILRARPKRSGTVACAYLVLYGVCRFFLEYLRADNRGEFPLLRSAIGLSPSQTLGLLTALPSAVFMAWISSRRRLSPR